MEGVIDKDYTAALLAREVEAPRLVSLTDVPHVFLHYGTPEATPLREVSLLEMQQYLDEGVFPAGSMGPKVGAALQFLREGGEEVIITDAASLPRALRGQAGTRIQARQPPLDLPG